MTDRTYTNPKTGEVVDADPRPFDQVLRELGEGATLSELSEAFYDVIQRVQETSKAGSVTLHLAVAFDGQGRLVVKDEVKQKLPEFSRPETPALRRDSEQVSKAVLADALAVRAERDALAAKVERVRAMHRECPYADPELRAVAPSLPAFVCQHCRGQADAAVPHPCPTIRALDGTETDHG